MRPARIDWIDAKGCDGWVEHAELLKERPTTHHAIGYVVQDTPDYVTITMSYNDELDNLGAWTVIPRCMITNLKYL